MVQIYAFLDMEPFDPAQVRDQLSQQEEVPVRRPLYGLEGNEEKHATLQVLQNSNSSNYQWRDIVNSSVEGDPSDGVPRAVGTSNLIITSVKYAQRENIQLVETFADSFLYAFGSAPVYLQVQAILLKSKNFPWRNEWLLNYSKHLRAGRTVDASARAYMTVEDMIYEGHIISCDIVDDAESPNVCPMQFIMYLTNVVSGDVGGAYYNQISGTKSDGTTGTTRVSTGEYLLGGPSRPADREYAFDENGNLILTDINRIDNDALDAALSRERALADYFAAEGLDFIDVGVADVLTKAMEAVTDARIANNEPRAYSTPPSRAVRTRAMIALGEIVNTVHTWPASAGDILW